MKYCRMVRVCTDLFPPLISPRADGSFWGVWVGGQVLVGGGLSSVD